MRMNPCGGNPAFLHCIRAILAGAFHGTDGSAAPEEDTGLTDAPADAPRSRPDGEDAAKSMFSPTGYRPMAGMGANIVASGNVAALAATGAGAHGAIVWQSGRAREESFAPEEGAGPEGAADMARTATGDGDFDTQSTGRTKMGRATGVTESEDFSTDFEPASLSAHEAAAVFQYLDRPAPLAIFPNEARAFPDEDEAGFERTPIDATTSQPAGPWAGFSGNGHAPRERMRAEAMQGIERRAGQAAGAAPADIREKAPCYGAPLDKAAVGERTLSERFTHKQARNDRILGERIPDGRTLAKGIARQGAPAHPAGRGADFVVELFDSAPWASLTYSGQLHQLAFRLEGPEPDVMRMRSHLEENLNDGDFPIPGYFLADSELGDTEIRLREDGTMQLSLFLRALTIEE